MKYNTTKNYLLISIKGMLMGIADLVPGVSGGTIALITGVYKDFITSINNINVKLLTQSFSKNFKSNKFDVLLFLVIGIIFSISFFSRLILFLLENYESQVSSFFFGLILCSIYVLLKKTKNLKFIDLATLIITAVIIYQILDNITVNPKINYSYIFLCGFLCSSAMILPGISGSYILLILGAYQFVLEKLNSIFVHGSDSYIYILNFIIGGVFGVLTFSRVVKWLLTNYENKTMIILIGLILGSVFNILPINSQNEIILLETFNFFTGEFSIILCTIIGFFIILLIDKTSTKNESY